MAYSMVHMFLHVFRGVVCMLIKSTKLCTNSHSLPPCLKGGHGPWHNVWDVLVGKGFVYMFYFFLLDGWSEGFEENWA